MTSTTMAYSIIWEFHVPAENRTEFEAAYASDGLWASLFAKADGFIGLDLLRCTESDARYLTIDRWSSQHAFENFKEAFVPEYEALDNRLEGITTSETRLGAFTSAP
jgi:heme-degrading monooxygenase HmoA